MSEYRLDAEFLKTLTVLYVEDDADTSKQLGQFLSRRAGRLIFAANGAEGLQKFIDLSPHIVVTDILMPEMDGLEMAGKIREIDRNVPIIVTTAFEQTDYMGRSIDIGVDKYVIKPVDSERFHAALIGCAHRLRAEELLRKARRLETEALRMSYLESLHLLAGGMAHDFNNLLQAILGYVYLAKTETEPGSKVREFLEMADKCSVQARELGERLLLVANADRPALHTASLGTIIHAVIDRLPSRPDVVTELEVAEDIPPVTCADSLMKEVVTQLVLNAIEAMPDGGRLRIAVTVCSNADGNVLPLPQGDYLQVVIADTGHGIVPEHLPRIFDPYFSTRNVGSQKGMGLGLALCETIVRKHGGMIRAESPPDEGAVFRIWLPVFSEGAAGDGGDSNT